jgi:hypothetical protein
VGERKANGNSAIRQWGNKALAQSVDAKSSILLYRLTFWVQRKKNDKQRWRESREVLRRYG